MRNGTGNFGLDAAKGEYVDLVTAGIIDPTKVVRTALENAVSVAGVLLLTEATLTEVPEPEIGRTPSTRCRWNDICLLPGETKEEQLKILLAIDDSKFSQAATEVAATQAKPQGTEVRVLHVIEPIPIYPDGQAWGYGGSEFTAGTTEGGRRICGASRSKIARCRLPSYNGH